jgi:hypothetical protein
MKVKRVELQLPAPWIHDIMCDLLALIECAHGNKFRKKARELNHESDPVDVFVAVLHQCKNIKVLSLKKMMFSLIHEGPVSIG